MFQVCMKCLVLHLIVESLCSILGYFRHICLISSCSARTWCILLFQRWAVLSQNLIISQRQSQLTKMKPFLPRPVTSRMTPLLMITTKLPVVISVRIVSWIMQLKVLSGMHFLIHHTLVSTFHWSSGLHQYTHNRKNIYFCTDYLVTIENQIILSPYLNSRTWKKIQDYWQQSQVFIG